MCYNIPEMQVFNEPDGIIKKKQEDKVMVSDNE